MAEPTNIALIDDDAAVVDSLRLYLSREGLAVSCFGRVEEFTAMSDWGSRFDCVVADIRMPGASGLDLVHRFENERVIVPIVLITGHGDVDMAVAAIKLGAFDFIEKPFDEARLLESIRNAVARRRMRQESAERLAELSARYQALSQRQRQVMDLAVDGFSNKDIAARLGISPRTVEVHRAWMMERMGASNLAELIRAEMQLRSRR